MFYKERASEKLEWLIDRLNKVDTSIIDTYPFDTYIDFIEKNANEFGYDIKNKKALKISEFIESKYGSETQKRYHQAILVSLLLKNQKKLKNKLILDDFVELMDRNFASIYETIENNSGKFIYTENEFRKNIAIASLRMIPLGAQKINRSRLPGSIFIRGGVSQFFKALFLVCFTLRGIEPLVEIHTDSGDSNLLSEFNPEGWNRMYRRLASYLQIHTELKGVIGTSWFFDPALKRISPHLSYLIDMVLENGGVLFYLGSDTSNDALLTSKTRRKLFESGDYIPKRYTLIWPKNALIQWSRGESGKSV